MFIKNSILNSIAKLNRKNLFLINLKNYLFIIGFVRVILATCFHPLVLISMFLLSMNYP